MPERRLFFIDCKIIRNLNKTVQTHPTIGSNYEEIAYKNTRFQTWDVGGQDQLRDMWKIYLKGAQAVIFVIDSTDPSRMVLNRTELQKLFTHSDLKKTIFLVLANKQDKKEAAPAEDIIRALELETIKDNTWSVFGVSALTGQGVEGAFDWLVERMAGKL